MPKISRGGSHLARRTKGAIRARERRQNEGYRAAERLRSKEHKALRRLDEGYRTAERLRDKEYRTRRRKDKDYKRRQREYMARKRRNSTIKKVKKLWYEGLDPLIVSSLNPKNEVQGILTEIGDHKDQASQKNVPESQCKNALHDNLFKRFLLKKIFKNTSFLITSD